MTTTTTNNPPRHLLGLILFLFGLSTNPLLACGGISVTEKFDISFNEKLNIQGYNQTKAQATWQLLDRSNNVLKTGQGDTTGELEFTRPGTFKLIFTASPTDGHEQQSATATIVVHPVKMTFLFDEMQFSAFSQLCTIELSDSNNMLG